MKNYSLATRKGRTEEGGCKKNDTFFPFVVMQLTRVQLDYEAKHKLKLSSGGQPITDCENVPGKNITPDDCH